MRYLIIALLSLLITGVAGADSGYQVCDYLTGALGQKGIQLRCEYIANSVYNDAPGFFYFVTVQDSELAAGLTVGLIAASVVKLDQRVDTKTTGFGIMGPGGQTYAWSMADAESCTPVMESDAAYIECLARTGDEVK